MTLFDTLPATRGADFSPCRAYRYRLWRQVGGGEATLCCILLNPSTADEEQDDPTVRRLMTRARAWAFGRLVVVNLFAFRATDPAEMKRHPEPVGLENDRWILAEALTAGRVLVAWGNDGGYRGRAGEVLTLLRGCAVVPWCLGVTKAGKPEHPLYVPYERELARYERE